MASANIPQFLASLHAELIGQASRVRDIIGEKHWLSDGKHKESLVSGLLARHLPHGFKVSSGFAISAANENILTRELDITIVDCRCEAPLLDQFNFSICFATHLAAMVSVKSAFSKDSFTSTLENWESVAYACRNDMTGTPLPSLNGLFFDEDIEPSKLADSIAKWHDEDSRVRDALSRLQSHRLVLGTTGNAVALLRQDAVAEPTTRSLVFYRCEQQAIAIVVSDILSHISHRVSGSPTELSMLVDKNTESTVLRSVTLNAPP